MLARYHPEALPVIDQLVAGVDAALGGDLLGIYVYGSLVCGDYLPGVSDIDLAVVLRHELDAAAFAALHQLHERVVQREPAWHNRLELAYVSAAGLRTYRSQKTCSASSARASPSIS